MRLLVQEAHSRKTAPAKLSPALHPSAPLQQVLGNQALVRLMRSGVLQPKLRVTAPDDSAEREAGHIANQRTPAPDVVKEEASSPERWISSHPPGDGLRIHPKLTVGAIDDPLEREADQVADRVMRMPDPGLTAPPTPSSASPGLQRKCNCGGTCSKCQEEQSGLGHESLRLKSAGPGAQAGIPVPPSVHEVLRSSGQPLDAATRAFMEPRFGYDFSRVRVHSGSPAEQSARDVNARAYTVGHNVILGSPRFAPGTHQERRLIAHELAHVLQQGRSNEALQRTPAKKVDCASRGPLKLPGGGTVDDPVGVITAAEKRANELLDATIAVLSSTRQRIRAGSPAGWPTVSDVLGLGLELMGLNPNHERVWKEAGSANNYTVAILLTRLRLIRRMIGDGSFFFTCLGDFQFCGGKRELPTGEVEIREETEAATSGHHITLCEAFWLHEEPDERANTIIHETAHAFAEFIFGGEEPFERPRRGSDVAACYARFAMLVGGASGNQRADRCPDPP
jgi:hypothetical protein